MESKNIFRIIGGAITVLLAVVVLTMWGCPKYDVYTAGIKVQEQNLVGEAALARAQQERQIAIAQSKAKAEAAVFEANADTTRAHGVARANAIIGERLQGEAGDKYLRYLWIEGIKENGHVIYVPTEAGMPILEAGKR
jgi:regulator of protease activity HflC (stomatin/prohibitin superfamily)